MASLKNKFIEGCITNDTSEQVANQLWDDIEKSQDYSFNKSHAACYALIAYQTAWLRQAYPCEYMAALISSVMNTKDRVPFYVNACHELGIEVLPPDVNESQVDFAVVEGKIRFGLNAVKGVGEGAARSLIRRARRAARSPRSGTSPSASTRASPTSACSRRSSSAARCPARARGCSRCSSRRSRGGRSSRPTGSPARRRSSTSARPRKRSRSTTRRRRPTSSRRSELLRMEKEVLGLYVTEHPLSGVRDQLRRKSDATIGELDRRRDGETVIVGGIVTSLRHMTTKRGDAMVFLRVEDVTGAVETVVFASTYEKARELCTTDRILIVKGRIDRKEGETKLVALELNAFEAVPEKREVRLTIDATKARAGMIRELAQLIRDFPGESPVYADLITSQGRKVYAFGPQYKVQPAPDFYAEVKMLLGESAVA